MILAEEELQHISFWQDYLSVQFDSAHLLSELGFSLVFELAQLVGIAFLWKRIIKPRVVKQVHKEIDAEHGYEHEKGSHT